VISKPLVVSNKASVAGFMYLLRQRYMLPFLLNKSLPACWSSGPFPVAINTLQDAAADVRYRFRQYSD